VAESTSTPERMKRILGFTAKVTLSLVALFIVFRKVDLEQLGQVLRHSRWGWFLPALLLVAGSKVLSAWRLNAFFRAIGLRLSEGYNLRLYWLGMYYNLFLPGGIGGDAYKVYLLKRQGQARVRDLVMATLADRALGLLALVLLALGLTAWLDLPLPGAAWWIWGAPLCMGAAWLALYLIRRDFLPVFWPALAQSLGVQLLQMLAVGALLQMTGTPFPWLGYLFLFLLSSVLTALPISYGGAGAREIAFYFGATYLGLPEAPAVALSLLFYLASLLVSLSGMRYSFGKRMATVH
jgi:glycosyltransferase 2 family protein